MNSRIFLLFLSFLFGEVMFWAGSLWMKHGGNLICDNDGYSVLLILPVAFGFGLLISLLYLVVSAIDSQ